MQSNPNREKMNYILAMIRELGGRLSKNRHIGWTVDDSRKNLRKGKAKNAKDCTLRSKRYGD